MSATNLVAYKLLGISWGTALNNVIGGMLSEITNFLPVMYDGSVYNQINLVQSEAVEGESVSFDFSNEFTRGQIKTLTFQLLRADNSQINVNTTNMKLGDRIRDMNTAPFTKRLAWANSGTPVVSVTG